MRCGILVSSMGNFGKANFYNSQEIGLGKALSNYFEEVLIYKAVEETDSVGENHECLGNYPNVMVKYIPAKRRGINGIINTEELDANVNVLIFFSDLQMVLPKIVRWSNDNGVMLLPYIGVLESHSDGSVKRFISNLRVKKYKKIYSELTCLAKTPKMYDELMENCKKNPIMLPVGLDEDLLKKDYSSFSREQICEELFIDRKKHIVLFIGRMVAEKEPLHMVDLFKEIREKDNEAFLVMIGKGNLLENVRNKIAEENLLGCTRIVEAVNNSEIWKYYHIAEVFINLNKGEIFGMSILEAMYYGTRVIAWKAPGPNYLLGEENNCCSDEQIVMKYLEAKEGAERGTEIGKLLWKESVIPVVNFVNSCIAIRN